jgi:TPR repeat protein
VSLVAQQVLQVLAQESFPSEVAGHVLQTAGLTTDLAAARQYYELAAARGLPAAANNLGRMLLASEPVMAVSWLLQAAESGSTAAWLNLGVVYQQGLQGDGSTDVAAAAACFEHAASAGSARALLLLGQLRQQQQQW